MPIVQRLDAPVDVLPEGVSSSAGAEVKPNVLLRRREKHVIAIGEEQHAVWVVLAVKRGLAPLVGLAVTETASVVSPQLDLQVTARLGDVRSEHP